MDADVKWCDIDLFSDELCSCIASRFISLISSSFFVQMSQILSSRKLLPFSASCWHQLSISLMITLRTLNVMTLRNNVESQENFDDDAWKPKCQYCWSFWRWSHQDITMITSIIALTMMIMIWTRGLVRGCQEVARSRSPCPRPAADKHTPPNALNATCNAIVHTM